MIQRSPRTSFLSCHRNNLNNASRSNISTKTKTTTSTESDSPIQLRYFADHNDDKDPLMTLISSPSSSSSANQTEEAHHKRKRSLMDDSTEDDFTSESYDYSSSYGGVPSCSGDDDGDSDDDSDRNNENISNEKWDEEIDDESNESEEEEEEENEEEEEDEENEENEENEEDNDDEDYEVDDENENEEDNEIDDDSDNEDNDNDDDEGDDDKNENENGSPMIEEMYGLSHNANKVTVKNDDVNIKVDSKKTINGSSSDDDDDDCNSIILSVKESRFRKEFKQLKVVGRGGFGTVIKVVNKVDQCVYALKKINFKSRKAGKLTKKLQIEVMSLANLNHMNIVRYHSSWIEENPFAHKPVVSLINEGCRKRSSSTNTRPTHPYYYNPLLQPTCTDTLNFNCDDDSDDNNDNNNNDDVFQMDDDENNVVNGGNKIKMTKKRNANNGKKNIRKSANNNNVKASKRDEWKSYSLYIQMQFYKQTLESWIASPEHDKHIEDCYTIFRQIVDALSYIHASGIIHRDLKPGNIFLTAKPSASSSAPTSPPSSLSSSLSKPPKQSESITVPAATHPSSLLSSPTGSGASITLSSSSATTSISPGTGSSSSLSEELAAAAAATAAATTTSEQPMTYVVSVGDFGLATFAASSMASTATDATLAAAVNRSSPSSSLSSSVSSTLMTTMKNGRRINGVGSCCEYSLGGGLMSPISAFPAQPPTTVTTTIPSSSSSSSTTTGGGVGTQPQQSSSSVQRAQLVGNARRRRLQDGVIVDSPEFVPNSYISEVTKGIPINAGNKTPGFRGSGSFVLDADTFEREPLGKSYQSALPHNPRRVPCEHTVGIGTRLYASPEQISKKTYDEKTDVYSLGIICFELFHKTFATEMERRCTILALRKNGELPGDFVERFPEIAAFILRCMADDPQERPSAAEILDMDLWAPLAVRMKIAELKDENAMLRERISSLEAYISGLKK